MTTTPDLQALACEDCIADISLDWQQGLAGRVLVAAIRHDDLCPWLFRVAPTGATIACEWGIITHYSNATAEPPQAVGGEA